MFTFFVNLDTKPFCYSKVGVTQRNEASGMTYNQRLETKDIPSFL